MWWVCTGEATRAFLRTTKRTRWHGCRRHASDTRRPRPRWIAYERTAGWRESNRSRIRLLSSAPLGHSLSGGLFFCAMVGRGPLARQLCDNRPPERPAPGLPRSARDGWGNESRTRHAQECRSGLSRSRRNLPGVAGTQRQRVRVSQPDGSSTGDERPIKVGAITIRGSLAEHRRVRKMVPQCAGLVWVSKGGQLPSMTRSSGFSTNLVWPTEVCVSESW
jgi:hypothetical protein